MKAVAPLLGVFIILSGCLSEGTVDRQPRIPSTFETLQTALLLTDRFPNVTVEIDYVEGKAPGRESLENIRRALLEVAQKERVTLLEPAVIRDVVPDRARQWTVDEVHDLDRRTRDFPVAPGTYGLEGTAYLHVLYLDGEGSVDGRPAAGLEGDGWLALWPDTFNHTEDDVVPPHQIYPYPELRETKVLLHELGHAFGLVNCGIPMVTPREDPDSRCHSTSEESVMYVHTDWMDSRLGRFTGKLAYPTWFDDDDLEDIRAFQRAYSKG
ncbi:MAG TPA: hypothetical protein VNZ52_10410 [Candidatus Thermoplasmatota archaeon]|nr:hypothetical protein [Candidatus Thermoplasmatota archaeon]